MKRCNRLYILAHEVHSGFQIIHPYMPQVENMIKMMTWLNYKKYGSLALMFSLNLVNNPMVSETEHILSVNM